MHTFFTKLGRIIKPLVLGSILCVVVLNPLSVFAQERVPYPPESKEAGTASSWGITAALSSLGDKLIEAAAMQVQMSAGALVWLAGVSLDWIVNFTIIEGASLLNSAGLSGAINETWVVFRDLGNMFFIFIILYLAFQLILGIGSGHWRSLGWIIIMALVINFSLFFTKVVIDTSNLLALTFYEPVFKAKGGVASAFMGQLGLGTVWNLNDAKSIEKLFGKSNNIASGNKVLVLLGATVLSVITAFIFFALSILLIMRFLYLILLMIFSPLAFACYVIPGARHHFGRWWSKLVQQAFFAPAVFLLLFVAFKILGGVGSHIGELGSFGQLFASFDNKSLPIVFNFALSIFMFLYSLTLAMDMGMAGAKTTLAWGKSLNTRFNNSLKSGGSLIARNTVGSLARYASEQEGVKRFARSSPMTGQLLYGGLNKLQGVGGKGKTLADVEKATTESRSKFIDWATSSTSKPSRYANLAPEEKGEQKPEDKLSAQETSVLNTLKEHPEVVAKTRAGVQAELSKLKTEQKTIQDRLALIRTNPLKAATDYATDLPAGKTLNQLQSELEVREKTLLSSMDDLQKQDTDLQTSLATAKNREQELITRGQARIDEEKKAGERKEEEQKEKIAELGAAAGTSRFARDRKTWKEAFDIYGKKAKKKQAQKKQQGKKTETTEETIKVSDIESFEDLPEEIQDIAKKALEKKENE